jgi:multiple sugar transport system permease protein
LRKHSTQHTPACTTRICCPLSVRAFICVAFIAIYNYFLPLIVLNDPTLYTITVGLAAWNSQASAGGRAQALFPLIITGSLVGIVPIILAFLFLQRFWRGGLTFGSLKD